MPTAKNIDGWKLDYSGKVRDLYSSAEHPGRVLMVASDRVSAFDHVLSPTIPGKGELLTRLSLWWFGELDAMVCARGFASRSQAVATVLHRSLVEHRHQVGDRVMVGTITLFYDHRAADVQQRLAELQRRHIAEVISSLHVHLANEQTLEVVLVQGPAHTLQAIADAMITERGVISGRLELVAALIPQLHPFSGEADGAARGA